MRVECAWCGGVLGFKPGHPGKVSHGICEPCRETHFPSRVKQAVTETAVLALSIFSICYGIARAI